MSFSFLIYKRLLAWSFFAFLVASHLFAISIFVALFRVNYYALFFRILIFLFLFRLLSTSQLVFHMVRSFARALKFLFVVSGGFTYMAVLGQVSRDIASLVEQPC